MGIDPRGRMGMVYLKVVGLAEEEGDNTQIALAAVDGEAKRLLRMEAAAVVLLE